MSHNEDMRDSPETIQNQVWFEQSREEEVLLIRNRPTEARLLWFHSAHIKTNLCTPWMSLKSWLYSVKFAFWWAHRPEALDGSDVADEAGQKGGDGSEGGDKHGDQGVPQGGAHLGKYYYHCCQALSPNP